MYRCDFGCERGERFAGTCAPPWSMRRSAKYLTRVPLVRLPRDLVPESSLRLRQGEECAARCRPRQTVCSQIRASETLNFTSCGHLVK